MSVYSPLICNIFHLILLFYFNFPSFGLRTSATFSFLCSLNQYCLNHPISLSLSLSLHFLSTFSLHRFAVLLSQVSSRLSHDPSSYLNRSISSPLHLYPLPLFHSSPHHHLPLLHTSSIASVRGLPAACASAMGRMSSLLFSNVVRLMPLLELELFPLIAAFVMLFVVLFIVLLLILLLLLLELLSPT